MVPAPHAGHHKVTTGCRSQTCYSLLPTSRHNPKLNPGNVGLCPVGATERDRADRVRLTLSPNAGAWGHAPAQGSIADLSNFPFVLSAVLMRSERFSNETTG